MSHKIRDYPGGRREVDVRIRLPNGDWFRRRIVAPAGTKAQTKAWAEKYERDLIDEILRNKGSAEPTEVPTFRAFAPRFIDEYARANQQKPSGIESKESVLRLYVVPRFGPMRLDQLTASDVQKMKADLSQKSAKTVNNILSVLNKMLRVAVDWGVLVTLPVRITLLRTQDTEMTFYEPDVYARLVAAAARRGPFDELLVRLGGDAGLRRGELIGLRGENVDLRRQMLSVSHNVVRDIDVDTKGLKIRRIPMSQGLADLLQKHFAGGRGHLLRQADGETTTPKILRRQMARIELDAGLDGMGHLHILRHTFCSHLAMAGVPVLEIQRLAGHAHLTTTMKYMHLAPNADQRTAVGLLDKLRATVPGSSGEAENEEDKTNADGKDEDKDDDDA